MVTSRELLTKRYYLDGVCLYKTPLLKTGQTTQYNSELDDGYYEVGVAKSYQVLTAGQYSGTTNVDLVHLTDTSLAFVSATKKITDSNSGLDIFQTGDVIVVTGSTDNDGTYTIATGGVAAEIVVAEALTDEAAGDTVSIAKREAKSNNCVQDLNTGLMWLRDPSSTPAKMGIASNGKMPWTGQLYDIFQYCAAAIAADVGGHSDWRIPDPTEMASLGDFSIAAGAPVDQTVFPNAAANLYHCSSTKATAVANAIVGDFRFYPGIGDNTKTANYYIMLVRGGL